MCVIIGFIHMESGIQKKKKEALNALKSTRRFALNVLSARSKYIWPCLLNKRPSFGSLLCEHVLVCVCVCTASNHTIGYPGTISWDPRRARGMNDRFTPVVCCRFRTALHPPTVLPNILVYLERWSITLVYCVESIVKNISGRGKKRMDGRMRKL